MATGDIGAIINTLEYDASYGAFPSITHVAGNVYAIAYCGGVGPVNLRTVSIVDGVISNVGFLSIDAIGVFTARPHILHISGTVYAVVYNGADYDGWIKTVSISNDGATLSIINSLEWDTGQGTEPRLIHISGIVYAVVYAGPGNDGWLKTLSISDDGTSISELASLEWDTTDAPFPRITHISGIVYAIVYGRNGNGRIQTVSISADGLTLTTIANIATGDLCYTPSNLIPVAGLVYAYVYQRGAGGGGIGRIGTVSISNDGATLSWITEYQFSATCSYPNMLELTADVFGIFQIESGKGVLDTVEISDDGTTFTAIDTGNFETVEARANGLDMAYNGEGIYTIVYQGAAEDGYIATIPIETIILPTVTTNPATAITHNASTLNGTLDDDGGEACEYRFRYRKVGGAYGYTAWADAKTTGQAFHEDIIGLDPNTTYQFNAQARNSAGESAWGAELEFTTLIAIPTVTTDPATAIGGHQATLNGTLDDDGGEACNCGFEWGLTPAYGNTTPTQSKTTGQTFAQTIIGLDPNETYHFSAFATNLAGTSYGADDTFTTISVGAGLHPMLQELLVW